MRSGHARVVTTTPFLFFSGGVPLAGRMHRDPAAGLDRQPAVLVTGSWLTVKEQMPDRYAAELARRGWTALTFDFAGFGGSGGEPRQLESPARKMADLAAAAAYARSLSLVTAGPPALLAVCASAQYGLAAAAAGWSWPPSAASRAGSTTCPPRPRCTAGSTGSPSGWTGPTPRWPATGATGRW